MQHTLTAPPNGTREFDRNPAFNVLIAYEDFGAGKHAKQTYDFLVHQLGPECVCTNQMWKFGVLNIPKLREIAAQDAAVADIIIISCSGEELPVCVKTWIEDWLPKAHDASALVVLFEPSQQDPVHTWTTRTYLADVARRGGFEFFAQPDVWPITRGTGSIMLTGAEQSERSFTTWLSAAQPDTSFAHWGINE